MKQLLLFTTLATAIASSTLAAYGETAPNHWQPAFSSHSGIVNHLGLNPQPLPPRR